MLRDEFKSVVDENMHGQSGLDLLVEMYASDDVDGDQDPKNMQLADETESDEEHVSCGSESVITYASQAQKYGPVHARCHQSPLHKFDNDHNDQERETRMMQLQEIKNAFDLCKRPTPKLFNSYLTEVISNSNRLPTTKDGIELLKKMDSGLFWSLWKLMREKQGKTGADLQDKYLGLHLTRHIHNMKTAKDSGIRKFTNIVKLKELFGCFVEWKGGDFAQNEITTKSDIKLFMNGDAFRKFQSQYSVSITFKQVQRAIHRGKHLLKLT